jgi:hypothetical protein
MGVLQALKLIGSSVIGTNQPAAQPAAQPANQPAAQSTTSSIIDTLGLVGRGLTTGYGIKKSVDYQVDGASQIYDSSMQEAGLIRDEGDILYDEALRSADQEAEEGSRFQSTQKMKYLMSGVLLQGTPLLVLEDTAVKTKEKIEAIKERGLAQRRLAYTRANMLAETGRSKFLNTTRNAGMTGLGMVYDSYTGGLFNPRPSYSGGTP